MGLNIWFQTSPIIIVHCSCLKDINDAKDKNFSGSLIHSGEGKLSPEILVEMIFIFSLVR